MDKNMDELVSIIIPAYNAENYIAECVDSLLRQTYQNIQILLIDDGSKDKTGVILDALAQKDNRVQAIHQENQGVSAARNRGIRLAKGSLLCFVDSDDTVLVDSIATLASQLIDQQVDAVFGNYNYVYEGKTLGRVGRITEKNYTNPEFRRMLIDDGTLSGITFGSACGAIYKAALIRTHNIFFRENLKYNEDGVFNAEYCLRAERIRYVAKPVYNYRQWKNTKMPDIKALKMHLENATEALTQICMGLADDENVMERQLQARKLFCIFQLSVSTCTLPSKMAIPTLKSLWDDSDICAYRQALNDDQMSCNKKLLWRFIETKRYFLFYSVVHVIYPKLRKYVKR